MGIFDWISEKVSSLWDSSANRVGNIYNTVKDSVGDFKRSELWTNLPKTVEQWTSGQYHAPGGYNYCGPGTKLDSAGHPINGADSACMAHDYEYQALAKNKHKISQEDFNRMIRESDHKIVDAIDRTGQSDLGSLMSKWGIKGKMALEDLGLLRRDQFVT